MYFQIIITGKCNFACTYCLQKVKNNKTMNLETVQKTISFISSFFLKKRNANESLSISISGGEVLLYFDIVEILVRTFYISSRNNNFQVNFELSTNASLFSIYHINFFIKNHIRLYIGFDGIRKIQNKNRIQKIGKNSFHTSIKGIELAYKNGIQKEFLTINMVIAASNVDYLYKSYKYISKKFPNAIISMNIAYNTEWNKKTVLMLENQLQKISTEYLKKIQDNIDYSINLFDKQIISSILQNVNCQSFCGGGKEAFSVTVDGNILPCGNFTSIGIDEQKITLGTVFSGITDERINIFQDKIVPLENNNCKLCNFSNRCRRFCPFVRFMASGSEIEINEIYCTISKTIISVTDKFIEKLYTVDRKSFQQKYLININK